MCFDADTGKVLWEHKFNVFHTDIVSDRARLDQPGRRSRDRQRLRPRHPGPALLLRRKDGKVLWQHSLTEEYGRITGYGGRVTSPIVDGDLVILGMVNASWGDQARGGNRFVAFDKKTGDVVWWSRARRPAQGHLLLHPGRRRHQRPAAAHHRRRRRRRPRLQGPHRREGLELSSSAPAPSTARRSSTATSGLHRPRRGKPGARNAQGRVICLDAAKVKDGKPKLVWKVDGIKAELRLADPARRPALRLRRRGQAVLPRRQDGQAALEADSYGRATARGSPVWADGKIYVAEVERASSTSSSPAPRSAKSCTSSSSPAGRRRCRDQRQPGGRQRPVYFTTQRRDLLHRQEGRTRRRPTRCRCRSRRTGAPTEASRAICRSCPPTWSCTPGDSATFKVAALRRQRPTSSRSRRQGRLVAARRRRPAAEGQAPRRRLEGRAAADGKLTVAKDRPFQQGYRRWPRRDGLTARRASASRRRCPIARTSPRCPRAARRAAGSTAQGKFVVGKTEDGTKVLKKLANEHPAASVARANAYHRPARPDRLHHRGRRPGQGSTGRPARHGHRRQPLHADARRQATDDKKPAASISWDALPRIDKADRLRLEARRLVSHEADRRRAEATRPSSAARSGRPTRRSRTTGRVEFEGPACPTAKGARPCTATPPASRWRGHRDLLRQRERDAEQEVITRSACGLQAQPEPGPCGSDPQLAKELDDETHSSSRRVAVSRHHRWSVFAGCWPSLPWPRPARRHRRRRRPSRPRPTSSDDLADVRRHRRPQHGQHRSRRTFPTEWDVEGEDKNIKWSADLGSAAYGGPVIAGGKVFVGTNNETPRDPEDQGRQGHPHVLPTRPTASSSGRPSTTSCRPAGSTTGPRRASAPRPVVEGNRLYYVSNRCELVCADVDGDAGTEGKPSDHLDARHDRRSWASSRTTWRPARR